MVSKVYALLQHADGSEISFEIDLVDDSPPLHFDDDLGRPFIWTGNNELGKAVYREVRDTVIGSKSES